MNGTQPYTTGQPNDQTVLGLLLSLIAAGVRVRVLVWMPTFLQSLADRNHAPEHLYLASAIRAANAAAKMAMGTAEDLGVVCLDARVADAGGQSTAAAHHQKMCVIRYADDSQPVAFLGGVDLAYTRRDAPLHPDDSPTAGQVVTAFSDGDWQSGASVAGAPPTGIPALTDGWPLGDQSDIQDPGTIAAGVVKVVRALARPSTRAPTDLNLPVYGATRQIWHDQHLQLAGPVVATLQSQFGERWADAGFFNVIGNDIAASGFTPRCGEAWFSADGAVATSDPADIDINTLTALPAVAAVAPTAASSRVQMWRTIPARPRGKATLLAHGEFTVMAGYVNALVQAEKLVWVCDQYFWSRPWARLANRQLLDKPDLAVIVVLPPHADATNDWKFNQASAIHRARMFAIQDLLHDIPNAAARVGIFNPWKGIGGPGVYVHAKTHIYDGTLLVCGSANINRRSLTGDSEIALAVQDATLAQQHLSSLWNLFTAGAAWPTVVDPGAKLPRPYNPTIDPGHVLLDQLRVHTANLKADPQVASVTSDGPFALRVGSRDNNMARWKFGTYYRDLMESCSLNVDALESGGPDLAAITGAVQDPDQFAALGRTPHTKPRFTYSPPPMDAAL